MTNESLHQSFASKAASPTTGWAHLCCQQDHFLQVLSRHCCSSAHTVVAQDAADYWRCPSGSDQLQPLVLMITEKKPSLDTWKQIHLVEVYIQGEFTRGCRLWVLENWIALWMKSITLKQWPHSVALLWCYGSSYCCPTSRNVILALNPAHWSHLIETQA